MHLWLRNVAFRSVLGLSFFEVSNIPHKPLFIFLVPAFLVYPFKPCSLFTVTFFFFWWDRKSGAVWSGAEVPSSNSAKVSEFPLVWQKPLEGFQGGYSYPSPVRIMLGAFLDPFYEKLAGSLEEKPAEIWEFSLWLQFPGSISASGKSSELLFKCSYWLMASSAFCLKWANLESCSSLDVSDYPDFVMMIHPANSVLFWVQEKSPIFCLSSFFLI